MDHENSPGYGEQPSYGSRPGDSGLPPPARPPQRRRTGLIVLGVIGAVVLAVCIGLAVVHGVRSIQPSAAPSPGRVHPTDGQTTNGAARTSPTESASPTESDSPPVPPSMPTVARPECLQCFPGLKVDALVAKINARGWKCAPDGPGAFECTKPNDQDTISVHNAVARDKTLVGDVTLHAFSGGRGEYPQGKAQAVAKARAGLPFVLAAAFTDTTVRAQLSSWVQSVLPACGASTTVDGYGARCDGPSAITIGGKKPITSWSVHLTFSGRRA